MRTTNISQLSYWKKKSFHFSVTIFFLVSLLFTTPFYSFAQLCNGSSIPSEPVCDPSSCSRTISSSTAGLNINPGEVVCIQGGPPGSPLSLTNVNLNGGVLQVCSGIVQGSISNFGSGSINVISGSRFSCQ